jgi:hypothetical protein
MSLMASIRRSGLLVLAGLILVALGWLADWWRVGVRDSVGGFYLFRERLIEVQHFCQADGRWAGDSLGGTPSSLGAEGCAVTCAAMVLRAHGYETDPSLLNRWLSANGGYTEQGWIHWEKAAELTDGILEHAYEAAPSYRLIDLELLRGNPVIVRVRRPGASNTHFVVVVGKWKRRYLVADPAERVPSRRYLDEIAPTIEALRFYRRLR